MNKALCSEVVLSAAERAAYQGDHDAVPPVGGVDPAPPEQYDALVTENNLSQNDNNVPQASPVVVIDLRTRSAVPNRLAEDPPEDGLLQPDVEDPLAEHVPPATTPPTDTPARPKGQHLLSKDSNLSTLSSVFLSANSTCCVCSHIVNSSAAGIKCDNCALWVHR